MSTRMTLLGGPEPSPRAARAHAMKNCVSIIIALCRLGARGLAGAEGERLSQAQSAAQRLRELLAEDLAASPAEAGSERGEACLCGVEELVKSVVDQMTGLAEEAAVRLTVDCGGGPIFAEEASLREALFNLISNAIEATPRGGTVNLETRELPGGDQRWVLRDGGSGIPSDHFARLGRVGTSCKQGGFGIGVAIARAAVARHGGVLHVESDRGQGTSVTVFFPAGIGDGVPGLPRSANVGSRGERMHLAAVRCIADELERRLAGETGQGTRRDLRHQLADELERLARSLRGRGSVG